MAHVPHLLIPTPWDRPRLSLHPSQAHHLAKVLRLDPGDPVLYTDGAGVVGRGRLAEDGLERGDESRVEPTPDVTMAVAPPHSRQRVRFLVEKMAEMGVRRLSWLTTTHTQGHPPRPEKAAAWAAAGLEQSRGAWSMSIDATTLDELDGGVVVADPGGVDQWPEGPLTVVIGPEGGLDPEEIPADAARVSLGSTILRVETAAIVAAALAIHRRSGE